jgi:Tol biopolymer transport system component
VQLGDVRRQGEPGTLLTWRDDSRALILSDVIQLDPREIRIWEADVTGKARTIREFQFPGSVGSAIALNATQAIFKEGRTNEIRLISLRDGSVERVLYPPTPNWVSMPVLSPDRKAVAFRLGAGADNTRMNRLEVHRVDGTGRVSVDLPFNAAPGSDNPAFLPGNDQMVVTERPNGDAAPFVYLVTLSTRSVKKLFSVPRDGSRVPMITVSPDGKVVAYVAHERAVPAFFTMDFASVRPK